ncbi:hypothetical protein [Desulfurispira natronophila]|uniref:hypothetical protein n=1 Tax=Desulfurispira natronophila TaxID=682562 RepID=UPI001617B6B8|nr:hypothetical protein [Desulfurispira natronophila]
MRKWLVVMVLPVFFWGCSQQPKSPLEGITPTHKEQEEGRAPFARDLSTLPLEDPKEEALLEELGDRFLSDSIKGYVYPHGFATEDFQDREGIEAYHDTLRALAVILDFSPQYYRASRQILQGIIAASQERNFTFVLFNSGSMDTEQIIDDIRPYSTILGPLQPGLLNELREEYGGDKHFITPTIANNPQNPHQFSAGLSVEDEVATIVQQMKDDGVYRYVIFRPSEPMTTEYSNTIKQQTQGSRFVSLFRERIYSKEHNNQSRVIREFLGTRIGHLPGEKFPTYTTDFEGVFLPTDFLDAIVVLPLFAFYNFDVDSLHFYGSSYWHDPKILEAAPFIYGAKFPTLYISDDHNLADITFRDSMERAGHSPDDITWLSAQGYDAAVLSHLILRYGSHRVNQGCYLGATGQMYRDEESRHVKQPAMVEVARGGFRVYDGDTSVFRIVPGEILQDFPYDEVFAPLHDPWGAFQELHPYDDSPESGDDPALPEPLWQQP